MATCADCVHVEACTSFANMILDAFNVSEDDAQCLLKKCTGDATVCNDFADRSQFAELPRVGDKVYELCRINQFGDYKIDESEIRGFIVDTDGTAFDYELLGERFFLTREEAEKALMKEREANGQSQN